MTRLRLVHSGPGTPTPCPHPAWTCDELRIEVATHSAERTAFVRQVRHHAVWASHSLATGSGSAERHITALVRLALREQARATSAGVRDDEPTALAVAA